ncbi:Deoxyuridine 5'-triphosphate nucleotidohydrolase [Fusobacterium necrophorum subsp. funduliforme]|uniref:deoxyuridine 5'-triphosphate nucleotidohydrolase n=1 Tax=Fusobacterium necrophorum TaxID=859 RepID=UPI00370E2745
MRKFEVVKNEFRKHPNAKIQLPKRGTKYAAAYDFYLPVDVTLHSGEKKIIASDVKASMESNEVLMIYIRSSVGIKKNIVLSNGTGIIDADFYNNEDNDGNIGLALYNASDKPVELKAGERICQGIFLRYAITDDDSADTERTGGIGSTGTK